MGSNGFLLLGLLLVTALLISSVVVARDMAEASNYHEQNAVEATETNGVLDDGRPARSSSSSSSYTNLGGYGENPNNGGYGGYTCNGGNGGNHGRGVGTVINGVDYTRERNASSSCSSRLTAEAMAHN